ncbi:DUF2198 family protein [Mangrovibacillus cuniculi]|uniref:DUF2198 family protein n=1 Tax=Mangrovibacillus cuniculi TaxID=2593652 RepID=A0A7S8HH03_9BACI|nr:DUF2198 family protein [Mangrovibacillus cuniculi]QPC48443.1 DUF2198 family protein [Mangrovibacillus cuniculi]
MDKVISAMLFPAILVILFTHITYSRTVALLLTLALIAVSAYKGYTHTWGLIIIDAASLTLGLVIANWLINKNRRLE